jgi:signal transduction histidine kinase
MPVVPFESLLASTRPEYRAQLERFPIGSLLVVPLRIGERILGTLSVSRSPGMPPFNSKDQQLLQDLADRAAVTVENARLAERLQQAVRLRDEFLSIAGHELRTPLAALQLQVEGLLHQVEKGAMGAAPKRLVERLSKAQMHVVRLEVLIVGLLDVSRIAAGRLMLQREEMELTGLLSDILDRFSEHLRRAGCEVSMQAGEQVVGRWDRMRLDQVFTNLVGNALKYGAGKPIQIRIDRDEGRARVAVQDHGIGVSPEDRSRIFGRFERAVSERNYGGLGLGLWISRQIVEALGGRIDLESQLGAGSTFTVELPLQPEESDDAA